MHAALLQQQWLGGGAAVAAVAGDHLAQQQQQQQLLRAAVLQQSLAAAATSGLWPSPAAISNNHAAGAVAADAALRSELEKQLARLLADVGSHLPAGSVATLRRDGRCSWPHCATPVEDESALNEHLHQKHALSADTLAAAQLQLEVTRHLEQRAAGVRPSRLANMLAHLRRLPLCFAGLAGTLSATSTSFSARLIGSDASATLCQRIIQWQLFHGGRASASTARRPGHQIDVGGHCGNTTQCVTQLQ